MPKKEKLRIKMLRQQQIVDGAKTASRELTTEEQAEFDSLQREIDTLKAEIEVEERAAGEPEGGSDAERAILTAERQRVSEVTDLCREFDVDSREFIEGGTSIEQVRAKILEKLRAERAPSNASGSNMQFGMEGVEKFREAASDGILLRAGKTVKEPAPGSEDLRRMRLRDLAVECLSQSGVQGAHRFDDDRLFREALTPDSQFAGVLTNSVNKTMSLAYQAAPTTYQIWTAKGSNSDFKAATHYQISEGGDLVKMTQSGEFEFDEMTDRGVSKALATFGKRFGLTRQALINDDIGILTRVPEAYVRGAKRGINRLVYKMLGNNPTIFDGKALFVADHGNLAGAAAAIGVESVGLGRAAMRKQKNLRGKETLNISPRFLLIPAAKETDAEKFLATNLYPSQASEVNPFAGKLQPVADAELDEYSLTAWYLAAAPGDAETIEVTYLNGDDMPKLESRIGFEYLGIEWRIYIDYGVTALDFRGLYKNAGA